MLRGSKREFSSALLLWILDDKKLQFSSSNFNLFSQLCTVKRQLPQLLNFQTPDHNHGTFSYAAREIQQLIIDKTKLIMLPPPMVDQQLVVKYKNKNEDWTIFV